MTPEILRANKKIVDDRQHFESLLVISLLIFSAGLALTVLTILHIYLLLSNQTTYEFCKRPRPGQHWCTFLVLLLPCCRGGPRKAAALKDTRDSLRPPLNQPSSLSEVPSVNPYDLGLWGNLQQVFGPLRKGDFSAILCLLIPGGARGSQCDGVCWDTRPLSART